MDILYSIITWYVILTYVSRYKHKRHQLSTVTLNCYCEGPTAFCKQSQLKAGITVTDWIRGQVFFPLIVFISVLCRRASSSVDVQQGVGW